MFGFSSKVEDKRKNVERAADRGIFRNLFHAAASIRKKAAGLIKRGDKGEPSPEGEPPHTHRGAWYRRALRYDVDKQKQDAVIGFRHSVVGDVGAVHEFGEERGGVTYPVRPTLGPALDQSIDRLGPQWQGTIGA